MAWNEPGGDGQDPWGHRKNEQGPPDLDDLIRKMQDKLGDMFGGGNRGRRSHNDEGGGDGGGGEEGLSWSVIAFFAVIIFAIWSLFGFYIVQPAEMGVVTQFGRYKEMTQDGLNWHWPYPIEQVEKVNVKEVRAVTHKALMLTQDENIVEIELVVQYLVNNAKNYLFNVRDPDDTLLQATESALREVVGTSNMNGVLTSERTRVAVETKVLIQNIVNRYETGLQVTQVTMQNAQPPAAVQAAFADVIKAREDEERSKNEAYAYANEIVEKAKGYADKLRQEAKAYKAQVMARSEGETKRFLSVLAEYEKAPEITRQRLYIESMESVLSNTSKVMVDVQSGNNLMVLPLDRLLGHRAENFPSGSNTMHGLSPSASRVNDSDNQRNDPRNRGGR